MVNRNTIGSKLTHKALSLGEFESRRSLVKKKLVVLILLAGDW